MTKQDTAVAAANAVIAFMSRFRQLRSDINEFIAEYNSENPSAVWANLPTAVWNPDGSQGAADGAPNPAHPITTQNILRSDNALLAGVTFLQDFEKFLTNQAVGAAQRSQTIDDLVS